MAKKSKTQRAKASAARSAKKEQARAAEELGEVVEAAAAEPEQKKSLFKKKEEPAAEAKKKEETKKPKKERFKFFKEVRSEMKRVTWPTKQEVLRWSVVVVVALLFFGVFVALLDNVIITPILVGVSSLGA